jgi:SIR2-like domain
VIGARAGKPPPPVRRVNAAREGEEVNTTFDRLVERIRDQKVLLFCGPHVSASSKELPAWNDLVQEVMGKLDLPDTSGTPILSRAAQFYVYPESRYRWRGGDRDSGVDEGQAQKRRSSLIRHIAAYLDDPTIAPSDVHAHIAALPFNYIVTTNWDNLLERAFDQQRKPYVKVVRDPDMAYTDAEVTTLVKLFGSIEQPESLVITLDDLRKLTVRIPETSSSLHHCATVKTLLFLGFDFADYETKQLYDTSLGALMGHTRQVFAVQGEHLENADYWQHRGFEFIHDSMLDFLTKVSGALSVFVPPATKYHFTTHWNASNILNAGDSNFIDGRRWGERGRTSHS